MCRYIQSFRELAGVESFQKISTFSFFFSTQSADFNFKSWCWYLYVTYRLPLFPLVLVLEVFMCPPLLIKYIHIKVKLDNSCLWFWYSGIKQISVRVISRQLLFTQCVHTEGCSTMTPTLILMEPPLLFLCSPSPWIQWCRLPWQPSQPQTHTKEHVLFLRMYDMTSNC